MTEEQIKQELEENERLAMLCVCDTLRNYGERTRVYLADFVSALCNVEKEKIFADNSRIDAAQARWLFWYAYRYMTNETYEKIGLLSEKMYGKKFTKVGVASSVNKMSILIEREPIWKKRWTIIKRIIKQQENNGEVKVDNTIVVQVPRELKDKLSIVIKEK